MTPGNPDLFGSGDAPDGDEESAPSPFFAALEAAGGAKIGRPKGARNKKTEAFEKWFYAMGYRDPAQVLAELMTIDPLALRALATSIGEKPPSLMEALQLRRAAAEGLMPYLHGKMPTEEPDDDEKLPTLMIFADSNQIEQAKLIQGQRVALSVGSPLVEGEANEINDLGEGEK